jgi:hypothetical protein
MALVSGTDSPLPPLSPMPRSVVMSDVNAYAQFLAGWPQQPINVVFSPPSDEQKLQSLIAAPGARNIPLQFAYTGGSEVVVSVEAKEADELRSLGTVRYLFRTIRLS